MREFGLFNQILLSLFDVLKTFYHSILGYLFRLTHFRFNINRETHLKCQINLQKIDLKDQIYAFLNMRD